MYILLTQYVIESRDCALPRMTNLPYSFLPEHFPQVFLHNLANQGSLHLDVPMFLHTVRPIMSQHFAAAVASEM